MATGQVPPEKRVRVHDVGKNAVGLGRSWYLEQPVSEWTAEQYVSCEEEAEGDEPRNRGGAEDRDLRAFIELMTSDRLCLWGECYQAAERRRQQKALDDAAAYEANPPWYAKAWRAVAGGPKPAAAPEAAERGTAAN